MKSYSELPAALRNAMKQVPEDLVDTLSTSQQLIEEKIAQYQMNEITVSLFNFIFRPL